MTITITAEHIKDGELAPESFSQYHSEDVEVIQGRLTFHKEVTFDKDSTQNLQRISNVTFYQPCFLVDFPELVSIKNVDFLQNGVAINCKSLETINYATFHHAFEIDGCPEFEQFYNTTFTGSAFPNTVATLSSTQLTSLGGITFSANIINLCCCYALEMSEENTSVIRELVERRALVTFPSHFCAKRIPTGYTVASAEEAEYLSERNILLLRALSLLSDTELKSLNPEYTENNRSLRIPYFTPP